MKKDIQEVKEVVVEKPANYWTGYGVNNQNYWAGIDVDGKPVRGFDYLKNSHVCFSPLFGTIDNSVVAIKLSQPREKMMYNEEFIHKYIELINQKNFFCSFDGIAGNDYQFTVDMTKYTSKTMLCSTLTLLRYLWEDIYQHIPDKFMKIIEEGEDVYMAIQKAHYLDKGYHQSLHGLKMSNKIVTEEEFLNKVRENENNLYSNKRPDLNQHWG